MKLKDITIGERYIIKTKDPHAWVSTMTVTVTGKVKGIRVKSYDYMPDGVDKTYKVVDSRTSTWDSDDQFYESDDYGQTYLIITTPDGERVCTAAKLVETEKDHLIAKAREEEKEAREQARADRLKTLIEANGEGKLTYDRWTKQDVVQLPVSEYLKLVGEDVEDWEAA